MDFTTVKMHSGARTAARPTVVWRWSPRTRGLPHRAHTKPSKASQNQAQDVATNGDRELDRFDSPQSFKSIQQSEGDPGTAPHVPPADVPPQGGLQGAGPAGVPVTAGTEFTSQDLKEGQGGSGPVWEVAGAEEAGGMGQPQPASEAPASVGERLKSFEGSGGTLDAITEEHRPHPYHGQGVGRREDVRHPIEGGEGKV